MRLMKETQRDGLYYFNSGTYFIQVDILYKEVLANAPYENYPYEKDTTFEEFYSDLKYWGHTLRDVLENFKWK